LFELAGKYIEESTRLPGPLKQSLEIQEVVVPPTPEEIELFTLEK